MNVFANILFWLVPMSANLKKSIRGVIFDLDGTLLDTEALADTAILDTFGSSFDKSRRREILEDPNKLPWNLKKNILGLRGSEWYPIVLDFARREWGVTTATDEGIELSQCVLFANS